MYILILWSINLICVWIFIDRIKILCLFDKNEFVEWLYGMMNLEVWLKGERVMLVKLGVVGFEILYVNV